MSIRSHSWSRASGLIATALGIFLGAGRADARTENNARVDALFAQWNQPGSPGAAVVIVKDGAVVYQHGYGHANLEHRISITPETLFDVASVAKQFTGLAVAMLIEQGKLSLDEDIHKYLPDVPDFGKPITIANLLHHTSGLRDWPETLRLSGLDMEGPISLETILEMVRRQRELDFAPGEEHLYSNTGYNLLAAAVAKVTGQSFRAWTEANIFRPLGMKHTLVCDDTAEIMPNCADSYAPSGNGRFRHVTSQLSAQGSSSLFITAEDMGKWLLNFEAGRVGGKTALQMILQPGNLNNGRKVDYGFGLGLKQNRGVKMVSHTGSWAGYRSVVLRIPEKRFAVAILANTANLDTYAMAVKVAELYGKLPPAKESDKPRSKSPVAVKSDPATWDPFLGTYRLGPGWLLTITREGNQLMAQATREARFQMTPVSDTRFFVEAYGAPVEFVRKTSGPVTNLLYRGINAPRLTLAETLPARLEEYVGNYWSEELQVAVPLEIHDGKLAHRLRSGIWVHLLPTDKDRFDAEAGAIAIEFTRNPDSQVTEMKVSGGRVRHIRYKRLALPKPD
jgi:CubicO group peptidase (beta-lactamase class C family)